MHPYNQSQAHTALNPSSIFIECALLLFFLVLSALIAQDVTATLSFGTAMFMGYAVMRTLVVNSRVPGGDSLFMALLVMGVGLRLVFCAASFRFSVSNGSVLVPFMPWFDSTEWYDNSVLVASRGVGLTNFDSGHAAVVGYLFKLVGTHVSHAVSFNLFFSIVNMGLITYLSKHLFETPHLSRFAFLLTCFFPYFWLYDTVISKDTATMTAALLSLASVARFIAKPHSKLLFLYPISS